MTIPYHIPGSTPPISSSPHLVEEAPKSQISTATLNLNIHCRPYIFRATNEHGEYNQLGYVLLWVNGDGVETVLGKSTVAITDVKATLSNLNIIWEEKAKEDEVVKDEVVKEEVDDQAISKMETTTLEA